MKAYILLLFSLAACLAVTAEPGDAARVGAAGKIANVSASYKISEQDMVSISVYDEPDLSVQARVDGNGRIKIPLLGTVELTGYTVRDAETFLEQEFVRQRYLRDPAVTVSVVSYAPREVIVLGEVGRPGPLALPVEQNTIDIVELIARVGGFSGIAKSSAVSIKRELKDGTVREFTIDVEEIIEDSEDGQQKAAFAIQPGDVIFVPERLF